MHVGRRPATLLYDLDKRHVPLHDEQTASQTAFAVVCTPDSLQSQQPGCQVLSNSHYGAKRFMLLRDTFVAIHFRCNQFECVFARFPAVGLARDGWRNTWDAR